MARIHARLVSGTKEGGGVAVGRRCVAAPYGRPELAQTLTMEGGTNASENCCNDRFETYGAETQLSPTKMPCERCVQELECAHKDESTLAESICFERF